MRSTVLALLVSAALAGCGGSDSGSKPAAAEAQGSQGAAPVAPQPKATKVSHNYVVEENGEYGYESGISEDDQKAGKVAGSITMVRYLGVIKGNHTLVSISNGVKTTITCKEPCEFAKIRNSVGGVATDPQILRIAEGSLGYAMVQDAINGELKVFKK